MGVKIVVHLVSGKKESLERLTLKDGYALANQIITSGIQTVQGKTATFYPSAQIVKVEVSS